MASENGHIEVVRKLLQHGAKVDLQNNVSVVHSSVKQYASFMC